MSDKKLQEIAYNIVENAFRGKKDRAGEPYINHLKRVKEYTTQYYDSIVDMRFEDYIKTVALLHDLVEDCPEWSITHIESIFGNEISESVKLLTRPENIKLDDYIEYITNISKDRFARIVKLADLKDNMDLTRLPKLTDKDITRTKKYHEAYVYLLNNK